MPTIQTVCRECGTPGVVEVDAICASVFTYPDRPYPWYCPACKVKHDRVAYEQEQIAKQEEHAAAVESSLELAGVPRNYRVTEPPVRFVAEYMVQAMARKPGNLLVNGETGSGKSTSAGYLARTFIEAGKRVRYLSLADVLDQWRQARAGDNRVSAVEFAARLERCDLLIIDEASADKTVVTQSGQECMWRLLEDVYSGYTYAHVVFLGNYYRGSVGDVFGNEAAARRRLAFAFECVTIDRKNEKIIRIGM